jgi:hypothetical protein
MNQNRCACAFLAIAAILVAASCREKIDISGRPAVSPLIEKCLETSLPLFLVERTRVQPEAEITRVALVPPNTVLAPYSFEEFMSGSEVDQSFARLLRVVPVGAKLWTHQVWQLTAFEGATIAVEALLELGDSVTTVDASDLLDDYWLVFLADGQLDGLEKSELAGRRPFDSRYARPCTTVQH